MAKVDTIKVSGGEYAKVADRLQKFREDNPNGSIKTVPQINEDNIIFQATIIKDKSKPESADATGHAMGTNKGQKSFEKIESIAVGRALALLGYSAGGEIASSEEMEEFNDYKKQQRSESIMLAIEMLEESKTLEELRTAFTSLGNVMAEPEVIEAKDKRKAEINASN